MPSIHHVCSSAPLCPFLQHSNTPIIRSNRFVRIQRALIPPSLCSPFVKRCAVTHTSAVFCLPTALDKTLLSLSNLCSITLPSTSTRLQLTFTPTIHHRRSSPFIRFGLPTLQRSTSPTPQSLDRTGPHAYHVLSSFPSCPHCWLRVTHQLARLRLSFLPQLSTSISIKRKKKRFGGNLCSVAVLNLVRDSDGRTIFGFRTRGLGGVSRGDRGVGGIVSGIARV